MLMQHAAPIIVGEFRTEGVNDIVEAHLLRCDGG